MDITYGLPLEIIDAEFQFDRHKLTVFYYAHRRIDFRELVRDLFGRFKARIWMQQVYLSAYTMMQTNAKFAALYGPGSSASSSIAPSPMHYSPEVRSRGSSSASAYIPTEPMLSQRVKSYDSLPRSTTPLVSLNDYTASNGTNGYHSTNYRIEEHKPYASSASNYYGNQYDQSSSYYSASNVPYDPAFSGHNMSTW